LFWLVAWIGREDRKQGGWDKRTGAGGLGVVDGDLCLFNEIEEREKNKERRKTK